MRQKSLRQVPSPRSKFPFVRETAARRVVEAGRLSGPAWSSNQSPERAVDKTVIVDAFRLLTAEGSPNLKVLTREHDPRRGDFSRSYQTRSWLAISAIPRPGASGCDPRFEGAGKSKGQFPMRLGDRNAPDIQPTTAAATHRQLRLWRSSSP